MPNVASIINTKARPITSRHRFCSKHVIKPQQVNGAIKQKAFRSMPGPKTACQEAHITSTNNSSRATGCLRRACHRQSPSTTRGVANCTAR